MFGYFVSHPCRSESGLAVFISAHVIFSSCFCLVAWVLLETVCARVVGGGTVAVGPAVSACIADMFAIGPHARAGIVVAVVVATVSAVGVVVVVAVALGVVAVRVVGGGSAESCFEGTDFVVFVFELCSEISDRLGELAHRGAIGGHGGCHIG